MAPMVTRQPLSCQAEAVDHDAASRSTDVDRWLAMLRAAIAESGWKHDALAEYLRVDKAHLSRLLSGEKPFRIEHLVGLPDDVEALFERRRAESFGHIVCERVDETTALQQLASGLLNLAASARLPARADAMAKAEIAPRAMAKAQIERGKR